MTRFKFGEVIEKKKYAGGDIWHSFTVGVEAPIDMNIHDNETDIIADTSIALYDVVDGAVQTGTDFIVPKERIFHYRNRPLKGIQ